MNNVVKKNKNLKAVDFFCSGGGMSLGMKKSGVKILAGIDYDISCKETYISNIKNAKFIHADIFNYKVSSLQKEINLQKNDDNLIMIGCSPCQFWSIINTDRTKSEKSKSLLIEFKRFVKYFNPGYVVVENVPGVLRRKDESGLEDFIIWLENHGYIVHHAVHNVMDYGVPQSRKRLTLIANRITGDKIQPIKFIGERKTVYDVIGEHNGFPKIEAGHQDDSDFKHSVAGLKQINIDRLKITERNGGSRMAYVNNDKLAPSCHKNNLNNFKDTYGRMWWNKPSPTITTKFFSISNGRFAHPDENRAISIREGAVLQSFPKDYKIKATTIANAARMIGNAVPPKYASSIANAIINNHKNAI